MSTIRRANIYFGSDTPQHPRDTYLWVNPEENTISRYDEDTEEWVPLNSGS